jgi:hypothetical protein
VASDETYSVQEYMCDLTGGTKSQASLESRGIPRENFLAPGNICNL